MAAAGQPGKKLRRRLLAAGLGLFALCLAEAGLRLFGVASDGALPREIFHRPGPAFVRQGEVYQTNDQYILGQSFAATKPAGTMRVFIVGGSVAMGFPLEESLGPAQLLRTALDAVGPGRIHEVINAAGFGFASRDVRRVVEEVVNYEPDLIIVMTGHNEFLERRFVSDDAPGWSRTRILLSRVRLYRVMEGAKALVTGRGGRQWDAHVVSAGERARVVDDFQQNLEMIAQACSGRVPVVLVTMPSNLQDFRPYGPSALSDEARQGLEREVGSYSTRPGGGQAQTIALEELEKQYPGDAWFAFLEGSYFLRRSEPFQPGEAPMMNETTEAAIITRAKNHLARAQDRFLSARNHDSIPVRADSGLNLIIAGVAQRRGLILADPETNFAGLRTDALAFISSVPRRHRDRDYFFDHCHPLFEGQRIIAVEILSALSQSGLVPLPAGWPETVTARWEELRAGLSPAIRAQGYYQAAYETGVNLDRPHRGLDYANQALELDPGNLKAQALVKRLTPIAAERYRFIGD